MARPIVVVGQQRSGTTVFREILASAGGEDIGEIFHTEFANNDANFYSYVSENLADDPTLVHPDRQRPLFRKFLKDRVVSRPGRNVILDIKANTLRFLDGGVIEARPVVIRFLRECDSRFVQVIRRNKLRQFVSERIAWQTGMWRASGELDTAGQEKRIHIAPRDAIQAIDTALELDRRAEMALPDGAAWPIVYESMFDDDGRFSAAAREVAATALEVDPADLAPVPQGLKKQNPEPLSALVDNFSEVADALQNTPHAWMLED